MSTYQAVMIDETGCEFGVSVPEQPTREAALAWLCENYPESRCDQLETPIEGAMREQSYLDDARRGIDYDEEGRPFFTSEGDVDEYEGDENDLLDDDEYVDDDSYDEYPEDSYLDSSYEES